MHKINNFLHSLKNYTIVTSLLAILFLGFSLRHYNFRTIPRHGATFDEFAWTWLGINLIKEHKPISWSSQPFYKNRFHLVYQGARFWIVEPYLEHPPFFGIVAGSFALLNGSYTMYDVTLSKIRPLSLILGILSILFIFLLTKELYGKATGILSAFLYAIVPTLVIGSRIVQNENFFIPFWLLSLYLTILFLKSERNIYLILIAIITGLLSLAKVPWLVAGLSIAMILSYKNKWKEAIFIGITTLLFFSLFIFYGLYFDKQLFLNLWHLQLARYDISFAGFFAIFTSPLLVDRYYLDGWILFGWFAVFLLTRNFKKYFFILIPFISYLIIYVFAIPNEPSHGWYRYPFYPFLIISIAIFVKEEIKNISLASLLFILIVGLSLLANTWEIIFGFSYFIYRLFIFLSAGSILLSLWFDKKNKWGNKIFIFWLLVFIVFSVIAVVGYVE